jgi:hypothetical protein
MNIKQLIRAKIPPKYIFKVLHLSKSLPFIGKPYHKNYSGNGEDIILINYLFKGLKSGTYIDIGAFHPKIISNTHALYEKG